MNPHEIEPLELIERCCIYGPLLFSIDSNYVRTGDPWVGFNDNTKDNLSELIDCYEVPKGIRLGSVCQLVKTLVLPFVSEVEKGSIEKSRGLIDGLSSRVPDLVANFNRVKLELSEIIPESSEILGDPKKEETIKIEKENIVSQKVRQAIKDGLVSSEVIEYLEGMAKGMGFLNDEGTSFSRETLATNLYTFMFFFEDILEKEDSDETRFDFMKELLQDEMPQNIDSFRKTCVRLRKTARDFESSRTSEF